MKSSGAIRQQLKQVSFRHLKKLLKTRLRKDPVNCQFNVQIALPNGDDVFVCAQKIADGEFLSVCDDRMPPSPAPGCEIFKALGEKATIKAEFKEFLGTASLAEIAAEYPDMAALMWALEDEAPNREVEIGSDEDWAEDEDTEETEAPETGEEPTEAWDAERDRLQEENQNLQQDLAAKTEDYDELKRVTDPIASVPTATDPSPPTYSWWQRWLLRLAGVGP